MNRLGLFAACFAASLGAGGLVLAVQQDREDDRARANDAPPGEHARGVRVRAVSAEVRGDVDGDGREDRAVAVEWPQPDDGWFGVRVTLSRHGTWTVWRPDPRTALPAAVAVADVNADGRGEVVLAGPAGGAGRRYELVTLDGDRPVFVEGGGMHTQALPALRTGWGCAGGRLYVTRLVPAASGKPASATVSYFRLAGGRLVPDGAERHGTGRDQAVPDGYARGVACPPLVVP